MNRLVLPDLLKGMAAIFMVQVHVTELFMTPSMQDSLPGKISLFLGGPFAAVVFMLVMGYFIANSKSGFVSSVIRAVKIFLLALLLNIGLNFNLLVKIYTQGWQYNPLQYIFGVDILFLAAFSILLLSVLKLTVKYQVIASLLLLIGVIVLSSFINPLLTASPEGYFLPFVGGNYSWSYFPLIPWLVYPLAGFIFGKTEKWIQEFGLKNRKLLQGATVAALLFVLLYFKRGFETTVSLPLYYHHSGWYILWALSLTTLWILMIRKLTVEITGSFVLKVIIRTGKNITAFYVIQWLIIGNIATEIYGSQLLISFPFWVAGIFALSAALTFGYEWMINRQKSAKTE